MQEERKYNHGLTKIQVEYKIGEIAKCKKRGSKPTVRNASNVEILPCICITASISEVEQNICIVAKTVFTANLISKYLKKIMISCQDKY